MDDIKSILGALEKKGRLRPADIVAEARHPDSPLHSHFEWDNGAAAEKYRLSQARTLIRTVRIDITVRDVPLNVVAYVRDPEVGAKIGGYRSVVTLRSEEDSARAAIIDEMKRVSSAIIRAKGLAIVLGMEDEINEIDRLAQSVSARASEETRHA